MEIFPWYTQVNQFLAQNEQTVLRMWSAFSGYVGSVTDATKDLYSSVCKELQFLTRTNYYGLTGHKTLDRLKALATLTNRPEVELAIKTNPPSENTSLLGYYRIIAGVQPRLFYAGCIFFFGTLPLVRLANDNNRPLYFWNVADIMVSKKPRNVFCIKRTIYIALAICTGWAILAEIFPAPTWAITHSVLSLLF